HITVDTVRWRSVLPWLHLLRAMQLCLRVRQVLAAMLGLFVMTWGLRGLALLPFGASISRFGIWKAIQAGLPHNGNGTEPLIASVWKQSLIWLIWPWETVGSPAAQLFQTGNSWSSVAAAWTNLLWSLLVWAVFGGAIARM